MREWTASLLRAAGLSADGVDDAVDNLEFAERRGLASHGFLRLPTYIARIQAGGINRDPQICVIYDLPALAVVDADAAIGARSATMCADIAISKANMNGVGVVLARNASHFGAAGYYTERMADAGVFGIVCCNTDAVMCAPFGGRAVLGSNPISMAAPVIQPSRPQLDMATTEAAHGKIIGARDQGVQIPSGWAVDPEGRPTLDPVEALAGALLPSGGAKGFGLAFMIDCLVAIGGAQTSDAVSPLYGDPSKPQELGHAFIAIAVDRVQTRDQYAARIDRLLSAVHASSTSGSSRAPVAPGELSSKRASEASSWTADASTLGKLVAVSNALGVALPGGLTVEEADAGQSLGRQPMDGSQ
ncbi:MAG: Ldh family oxidoreductase [Actinomycetota bacterium]|nr:Ldh family oxidoreductase [Actinomycetota bacterium]